MSGRTNRVGQDTDIDGRYTVVKVLKLQVRSEKKM